MIRDFYDKRDGSDTQYYTLLIVDNHQEYPLDVVDTKKIHAQPHNSQTARISRIWDGFQVWDNLIDHDDALLEKIWKMLPEEIQTASFSPHVAIWSVQGRQEDLIQVYNQYADHVFSRFPSGDDDTFDYWPTAFEMCLDLATDLDRITQSARFRKDLKDRYDAFLKANNHQEIMEHEYNPDYKSLPAVVDEYRNV